MKTLELAITLLYLVACIAIGYWVQKRAKQSKEDYWVAGRQIGTFANSWAMMAALASGGSVLGVTALGYSYGVPYVFSMYAGAVLGFPLASILIARQLRNLKHTTVTDYFNFRFKSPLLEWLVPILIVVSLGTYIVAQMKAAGVTASFLLGIPYNTALVITALVFIVYVSVGGMWAVTMTDIMQGILVVFMVLALALIAMFSFGGPGSLIAQATAVRPQLGNVASLPLISYIGAYIVWGGGALVLPHLVMRIFTSRDVKSAKLSLNYSMIIYALFITIGVLGISTAGHLVFPNLKDADTLFLVMTGKYLPRFFAGLAVSAVMAAVMSTTDGLLLACASAVAHDIYERKMNPGASDRTVINVGMVTIWVIGLLAMAFAFNPPKLLTMLYTAAVGLLVSSFLWPIVLGIWWKRANTPGATASVIVGAASYLYLLWFTKMPSLSHVIVSVPLSLAAMVVVSLLTPPPDPRVIETLDEAHRSE